MSIILTEVQDNEYGYDKRLHMKGATERVLDSCSHYVNSDGSITELGEDIRDYLVDEVIGIFLNKGFRTICLAYKDLRPNEGGPTHENDDSDNINKTIEKSNLTCLGILGIGEVIRPESIKSLEICK